MADENAPVEAPSAPPAEPPAPAEVPVAAPIPGANDIPVAAPLPVGEYNAGTDIILPEGVQPGMQLVIETPQGSFMVIAPPNAVPGMHVSVFIVDVMFAYLLD